LNRHPEVIRRRAYPSLGDACRILIRLLLELLLARPLLAARPLLEARPAPALTVGPYGALLGLAATGLVLLVVGGGTLARAFAAGSGRSSRGGPGG
jgi:hypothetical protein